jgi:hypothetical protein
LKVERKTNRDDYFVIHSTMPSGFECKIPARGYNLKSWLAIEDKLNATYYYEQTTKAVYEHLVFGDPNAVIDTEDDDEPRASKGKALKETAAKRKPRAKASEDSKRVSKSRGANKPAAKRTASNGKEARDELRKPKVRNVRKPKEDVQGTNNPRTKAAPRTRNSKTKTQ